MEQRVRMPAGRSDLADMMYFLVIARRLSFRGAAAELGVSAPVLSNAVRALEERLGVRLFDRTRRSVALTAAGEQLRRAIEDPYRRIDRAVDDLDGHRDASLGRIRLAVFDDAASLLLAPVMAAFADRHPGVTIETMTGRRPHDPVTDGLDASLGLGEGLSPDIVRVRMTPDVRWLTAAAPAYLRTRGEPGEPEDLRDHRCIAVRMGSHRHDGWLFGGPRGEVKVVVPCRLVFDESSPALAAAADGGGIVHAPEPVLRPMLSTGALRTVLEPWAVTRPGYHLWHSTGRSMSVALSLLIDLMLQGAPAPSDPVRE